MARRGHRASKRTRPVLAWVVGVVFAVLVVALLAWFSTADERPYRDGEVDAYVGEVVRVGDTASGCSDGRDTAYEFRFERPDDTGYGRTLGCPEEHAVGDQIPVWVLPDGTVTTQSPRLHELAARFGPWLVAAVGLLAVWLLRRRARE